MTLPVQSDNKNHDSTILVEGAAWPGMQVEHRRIGAGVHHRGTQPANELIYVLSGRSALLCRTEGRLQQGLALPGTSWLTPAGTTETVLELDGDIECLIIQLSSQSLEDSAVIDHGIDPARAELVFEGGFTDPTLSQIALAIQGLLGRPSRTVDRLLADGLHTALTAHLIDTYTIDRWQPAARQQSLEPKRLQRVLSYIEARLAETISLNDLAGEACLSPYHFARLFHQTMGQPPHRYLVERRVAAAQEQLRRGRPSMAALALDTGFGTQSNFSRVFRKLTGLTPREYRAAHAH